MLPKRNAVHWYIINQIEIDKGAGFANKHKAQGLARLLPFLWPGLLLFGHVLVRFPAKTVALCGCQTKPVKSKPEQPTQTRNLESGDFWQLLTLPRAQMNNSLYGLHWKKYA